MSDTSEDLSVESISGWLTPGMYNYAGEGNTNGLPVANIACASCCEEFIYGCMDDDYMEYNPNANTDNGSCLTLMVEGCTYDWAFNYNPDANVDDGSCIAVEEGCMDDTMFNYDPTANTNCANCCTPFIYGCMDSAYSNYNSDANAYYYATYAYQLGTIQSGNSTFGYVFDNGDGTYSPFDNNGTLCVDSNNIPNNDNCGYFNWGCNYDDLVDLEVTNYPDDSSASDAGFEDVGFPTYNE